jgi:ATPase subunit of ABC transporter with duplicated ATPase domains
LLILDEPTNHLDGSAIEALMRELEEIKRECAMVIISHDPDVARHADECWRIEEGRAVNVTGGVAAR